VQTVTDSSYVYKDGKQTQIGNVTLIAERWGVDGKGNALGPDDHTVGMMVIHSQADKFCQEVTFEVCCGTYGGSTLEDGRNYHESYNITLPFAGAAAINYHRNAINKKIKCCGEKLKYTETYCTDKNGKATFKRNILP